MSNSGIVGGGAAVRLGAFLFVALVGFAVPSAAQQPTSEQISAIRANCRSDYQRYCSSVPTGGSASLQCLEQNSAKLSGACQQAVSAAMGTSAPAPSQPASTGAAPAPTAAETKATLASWSTWPHTMNYDGAAVVVYQPQAMSWPEESTLNVRTAIAITRQGQTQPIVGTIEFSGRTTTDFSTRMVTVYDLKLTATHFPSLDTSASIELEGKIRQALPRMGAKSVPLDNVLLGLKDKPANPGGITLNLDPPVIFHSSRPRASWSSTASRPWHRRGKVA